MGRDVVFFWVALGVVVIIRWRPSVPNYVEVSMFIKQIDRLYRGLVVKHIICFGLAVNRYTRVACLWLLLFILTVIHQVAYKRDYKNCGMDVVVNSVRFNVRNTIAIMCNVNKCFICFMRYYNRQYVCNPTWNIMRIKHILLFCFIDNTFHQSWHNYCLYQRTVSENVLIHFEIGGKMWKYSAAILTDLNWHLSKQKLQSIHNLQYFQRFVILRGDALVPLKASHHSQQCNNMIKTLNSDILIF